MEAYIDATGDIASGIIKQKSKHHVKQGDLTTK